MQTKEEEKKRGVGLALSGGGSRAIAFHYGVLEELHQRGIDQKITVVSAISGGAVIGALWALHSRDWPTFSKNIENILEHGLQAPFANLQTLIRYVWHKGLDAYSFGSLLDKNYFEQKKLNDLPLSPFLILNAAELKTGSNFKFSRDLCGTYKSGGFPLREFSLANAVACSAAYPMAFSVKKIKLPSGEIIYLTDGGAYDCIGANALMPDKDHKSILVQNCETVIISDASFPFFSDEKNLSRSILDGLYASYLTTSNRNRSQIYNKLFLLQQNKSIPYLGIIKMDSRDVTLNRGWEEEELKFINSYKTDFGSVQGEVLKRIKERGQRLAKQIVEQYLTHL